MTLDGAHAWNMRAHWVSLGRQDSRQGHRSGLTHENSLQTGTVTSHIKWREDRSWFLPRIFGLEQTLFPFHLPGSQFTHLYDGVDHLSSD